MAHALTARDEKGQAAGKFDSPLGLWLEESIMLGKGGVLQINSVVRGKATLEFLKVLLAARSGDLFSPRGYFII